MRMQPEEKQRYFDIAINLDAFVSDIIQHVTIWQNNLSEIIRIYKNLKQLEKEKIYSSISVEVLQKYGDRLPIAKLRKAGYYNVSRLVNKSTYDLARINGVGSTTSQRLNWALRKIVREVESNVNLNILDYSKKGETKKLLHHLRTLQEYDKESISFKDFAEANFDRLQQENKFLKRYRSFVRRIFAVRKTKNQLQNLCNKVEIDLQSDDYLRASDYMKSYENRKTSYDDLVDNFSKNSIYYYTMIEDIVGSDYVVNIDNTGLQPELIDQIRSVEINMKYFKSSLRAYQTFGTQYIINQKNVLLGDDMGLGKTVQALAVMAHLKANSKANFFVIVPLTVLINWEREVKKHTELESFTLYGRSLKKNYNAWLESGGVAISTYDSIKKLDLQTIPILDMVVCDEAHYIKNESAERSRTAYAIISKSDRVVLLTGTPLENRLDEMVTLISKVNYEIGRVIQSSLNIINPDKFKQSISTMYLRRTRDEVLSELPELEVVNEWVSFHRTELLSYKDILRRKDFQHLRRVAWTQEKSSKLERLKEICQEAIDNNKKMVIYSFYLDVISRIHNEFEEHALTPITGSVKVADRQRIIDEFETSETKRFLISQVTTGGQGINLHFANIVVLCEPQLKPSTESQAIARVHRMGQTNNVLVYRLLNENSIDEHILSILERKELIFDSYAESSIAADLENASSSQLESYIIRKELERHKI